MNDLAMSGGNKARGDVRTWEKKSSYSFNDMRAFVNREYGDEFPYLPAPEFLLVQQVLEVSETGGTYGKGYAIAQYNIDPSHVIFKWHFPGKPILPGSWGIEAAWQFAGFHLTWLGARGLGMATGAGEVMLRGQILPTAKKLLIRLDVEQRMVKPKISAIQGDVEITCDGSPAYGIKAVKVKIVGKPAEEVTPTPKE